METHGRGGRYPNPPHVQRSTIESILTSDLGSYCAAIKSGDYLFSVLVEEAGLSCPRCGSGACATYHGRWYRKRVQDLATGEEFEAIPILRACFCTGATGSIHPADLWRGRSTVTSVLKAVVHTMRAGVGPALEWAGYAGSGEEPISERTLRRWKPLTFSRLVGASFSWLTSHLGWAWSDVRDPGDQLERLLHDLTSDLQLAFRRATGHSVLDRQSVREAPRPMRSSASPVPGRQTEAPPQSVPSILLPRGRWWPRTRRGPPDGQP
jgi:hypothetical protein